jgi:CheY-like chemotaxis protein
MDRETQSHVFEPFFTTKEPGLGTGLGLAMVHAIVEQNHGCISVDSEPGTGTAFKLYFPRTFEPVRDVAGPPAAEALGGSETLLLVEDEDSLRTLGRHILEEKGYTVLEARSGPEAVELCARRTHPVDLVITDVVMPEMGGRELVDRLTDRYPGLKAMYMSAYPEDTLLRKRVEAGTVNFLSKPFSPQELIRKVREVLTGEGLAAVDLDPALRCGDCQADGQARPVVFPVHDFRDRHCPVASAGSDSVSPEVCAGQPR